MQHTAKWALSQLAVVQGDHNNGCGSIEVGIADRVYFRRGHVNIGFGETAIAKKGRYTSTKVGNRPP